MSIYVRFLELVHTNHDHFLSVVDYIIKIFVNSDTQLVACGPNVAPYRVLGGLRPCSDSQ